MLEDLVKSKSQHANPSQGINLPDHGKIFFPQPKEYSLPELVAELRDPYADPFLIYYASMLKKEGKEAILVSKDFNLRLRARMEGVDAEDYRHDKTQLDLRTFFRQQLEYDVEPEIINSIMKEGGVPLPDALKDKIEPNQYLVLKHGSQSTLARYHKGQLLKLQHRGSVENIKPRNKSQHFLLDACLDPSIRFVAALGMAGTGKTLLSLVAGLHQVINEGDQRYNKVVVFRPTLEPGKELGFLPGELDEKISPYFQPINTALRLIFGRKWADYPQRKEWVECRPINYIRGDTLPETYILVDEAQNFTLKELKLIGTRMGEGSKIVVAGDPFQIDHPYLDERSAGLVVMTDKLRKKVPEFAYVILDKVERSPEAEIFAKYL